MKGVQRGSRVRFTCWRADHMDGGREYRDQPQRAGVVLDKAPDAGTWWVSVAGERAVVVHAKDMTPAVTMHGARA